MDALIRSKAEVLAREVAGSISTQRELSEVMRFMTKSVIERMLDAELDVHLGRLRPRGSSGDEASSAPNETQPLAVETEANDGPRPMAEVATIAADESSTVRNRRNGRSSKTVQGESGKLEIATPRDRLGTFEPLLIPKHERRLAGFDDKILALYAKGMSTRDIQELVQTLYDVELSPTLISAVTDAVDDEVTAWRSRPVEAVWPIMYFDAQLSGYKLKRVS